MWIVRTCSAALLAALVTPAAAEVENPGKVVCKSEKQNGTRIAKRTCMTAAEWEIMAEQAKRDAAESFNRSNRPWDDRDVNKGMVPGAAPHVPQQ